MQPPTTLIAALGLSASAGKNPWLLLGILFLAAAPASMPAFLVPTDLPAALHGLVSLRDQARHALKARIDGVIDLKAWLPPVCTHVWVPKAALAARDPWQPDDAETDLCLSWPARPAEASP